MFFLVSLNRAHHHKREAVKDLLASGRLELVSGGWVMTDEANVQLYSMIDQMIEGHQWIKHHLNYTAKNYWSIDPFGHGSTMPYLLKLAGFGGATVQRIHHGWKERLAELQSSDFRWRQPWDVDGRTDLMTHNFPFDIYNIKHSCGPHSQVCLTFDFRKVRGEFTEYTQRAQPITQWNLHERAETLLGQYGRTASLFPHNVAMVLVGDDFRYDHAVEWDQQFTNYNRLIKYINDHPNYHAHIQFGTLGMYFDEVRKRMNGRRSSEENDVEIDGGEGGGASAEVDQLPVLTGDFFVYSDVFNEGRPAYWSGYYTTRPFYKSLGRELESILRSTEIVYTLALARARQQGQNRTVQILERDYQRMTSARQRMADFQHHDAITGTSKGFVMHDFGVRLYDGVQLATSTLTHAVQYLLTVHPRLVEERYESLSQHWPSFLYPPQDRPSFHTLPRPIILTVKPTVDVQLVLVNTLVHFRQELIKVIVQDKKVRVLDPDRRPVAFQFTPVWNYTAGPFQPLQSEVQLEFIAELPPLSFSVYTLRWDDDDDKEDNTAVTTIYNSGGRVDDFPDELPAPVLRETKAPSQLHIENDFFRAEFDPNTGLLSGLMSKKTNHRTKVGLSFQAYVSAQFHSGAYLFMPEPRQPVINVSDNAPYFGVVRGPLYSEVIIIYPNFLHHVVRLYHDVGSKNGWGQDASLLQKAGLYMETLVDYPPPPHFRETELFMRLTTDVDNGDVFYTDSNCFQMQRRVRLKNLGPETNYYPLTCMMYVQDTKQRMSLVVAHAHGGSSLENGWMEVMLERRSMYDDSRGLGEGVIDNRPTLSKFWLILEERLHNSEAISRPTLLSQHVSNALSNPPPLFAVDHRINPPELARKVYLLGRPFPCDVHLVNWRVLPVNSYFEFPSHNALLLLHRQGYSCDFLSRDPLQCPLSTDGRLSAKHRPRHVRISSLRRTSLTALESYEWVESMAHIVIRPMEISAWNTTFV